MTSNKKMIKGLAIFMIAGLFSSLYYFNDGTTAQQVTATGKVEDKIITSGDNSLAPKQEESITAAKEDNESSHEGHSHDQNYLPDECLESMQIAEENAALERERENYHDDIDPEVLEITERLLSQNILRDENGNVIDPQEEFQDFEAQARELTENAEVYEEQM